MAGARVAKKIQKRWMRAFIENPSLAQRPTLTITLCLDERGRSAVENLAWTRAPNEPIDPATASASEKAFLSLPSETKLDIEFVFYGLLVRPGPYDEEGIRRALRVIAILAHSHGVEEGLKKMASKIEETIRTMRDLSRRSETEAG